MVPLPVWSSSVQVVPAIHGGAPDPFAALATKLAVDGSGEALWIAGLTVLIWRCSGVWLARGEGRL